MGISWLWLLIMYYGTDKATNQKKMSEKRSLNWSLLGRKRPEPSRDHLLWSRYMAPSGTTHTWRLILHIVYVNWFIQIFARNYFIYIFLAVRAADFLITYSSEFELNFLSFPPTSLVSTFLLHIFTKLLFSFHNINIIFIFY